MVGQTREQVIGLLGVPMAAAEHCGNPPLEWAKQYEPCETHTYLKWNGMPYVLVYPKDGQWVCFSPNWLPNGGAF